MKQSCWAVETTETGSDGIVETFVEIRLIKTPRMLIPYESMRVFSFDCAKKWAEEKGVCLKFATQTNYWNNESKIFVYGKVVETGKEK